MFEFGGTWSRHGISRIATRSGDHFVDDSDCRRQGSARASSKVLAFESITLTSPSFADHYRSTGCCRSKAECSLQGIAGVTSVGHGAVGRVGRAFGGPWLGWAYVATGVSPPAVAMRYALSRRFTSMRRRTLLSTAGVVLLLFVPGVISAKEETVTLEVTGMS